VSYFDANATTPLRPEAQAAWLSASEALWHNPSSPSRAAARARNALEDARAQLATLLGAQPAQIVFTSGATEANNAVLRHALHSTSGPLLIGATEHPSIYEAAHTLSRVVEGVPVARSGQVDLDWLATRLTQDPKPALVAIMAANNETGVIAPLETVYAETRKAGIPLLTDAVQAWGKIPHAPFLQADYFVGSAHKFGGPKGVGFLVLGPEQSGFRGQRGGAQENDHRGGTENLPGVLAMVKALEVAWSEGHLQPSHATARNAFAHKMIDQLGAQWVGQGAPLLPQTAMLVMPTHDQMRWVTRLDKKGFAISTGAACATGKEGPSHVLTAMGYTAEESRRALRFSALPWTDAADWTALGEAVISVADELDTSASPAEVIVL